MSILAGPSIQGVAALRGFIAVPASAAAGSEHNHDVRGYSTLAINVPVIPAGCTVRLLGRTQQGSGSFEPFTLLHSGALGECYRTITSRNSSQTLYADVTGINLVRFQVEGAAVSGEIGASLSPLVRPSAGVPASQRINVTVPGGGSFGHFDVRPFNTVLFAAIGEPDTHVRISHRYSLGGDTLTEPGVYTETGKFVHPFETPEGSSERRFLSDLRLAETIRFDNRSSDEIELSILLSSNEPPPLGEDPRRFVILGNDDQVDGVFTGILCLEATTFTSATRFVSEFLGQSSGDRSTDLSVEEEFPAGQFIPGRFERIRVGTGKALAWKA